MYDLATLSHRYEYAGLSTQNHEEYEKWNKNAIEDFQRDPFLVSNHAKARDDPSPSPYTKDIMNLIEQCMKPAAKDRIKAQEVKAITEKMLARYGSDNGLEMNEKVYFVGNEINGMQAGSEDFPFFSGPMESTLRRKSWTDIDQLMDYSVNPDEPELQPPRWAKELEAYKAALKEARAMPYNKYWEENCRVENGKVIFGPKTTTADGSVPPDDQDNDQDQAVNDIVDAAEDDPADEEPAKVSNPKAPSKAAAAGKGAVKKGAKGEAKATKAPKGAGVKKATAKKPAPPKPAAKGAAKKAAAQVVSTTTNDTSQAQASPPKRNRLPRAAKNNVGNHKV